MPNLPVTPIDGNVTMEQLVNEVAKLQRLVNFLINKGLDSENTREIGGWLINETDMISVDGDVGMSTEDTGGDDVRFHAGETNKDAAPWRVHKSGKMVATGALIQSADGSYPRVVMDPVDDLFGAYAAENKFVSVNALHGTSSSPAVVFYDGTVPLTGILNLDVSNDELYIGSTGNIQISALPGGELKLNGANVKVPTWGKLVNSGTSQTMQQALDSKGVSLAFDPGTRNLKLYGATGTLLSTVNIPLT